jgi:hypothetical protein
MISFALVSGFLPTWSANCSRIRFHFTLVGEQLEQTDVPQLVDEFRGYLHLLLGHG